ncbi:MAG TPA: OB-fold nucleic acid binding domain-containing protein, partial [Candidatus Saccharimonadales bacterium]
KHGIEPITYLHEGMRNSLEATYGILVYQEQFMQISKEWCGFTGGQADTLRKAVGKKKIDLMKKIKPEFVEGAIKHGGATKEMAETFWDQLEEFANYCFNKSHAACYGLIAYWTAYLKAHYPDAFMAAVMTSDQDDVERLAIEISECKHMGITVLSPSVNDSYQEFAVVPGKNEIRFGMAAVKGVGVGAVEEVLRAREEGKFESIEDFAKRVSVSKFNKKAWESLIKSGGFDEFSDRSDLLFNLETIQAFASKLQKEALSGQADLFGGLAEAASIKPSITLQTSPTKYTEKEQLMWERELMGLYISAHPLDNYDTYFSEQTIPLSHVKSEIDGKKVTIGGLVSTVRTIVTKSGTKMAFVKLEDKTSEAEVIVFPNLYEQVGAKLVQDAVIRASGKVSARDRDGNLGDDAKIIADEIVPVTDEELRTYESTGRKMETPRVSSAVKATRVAEYRAKKNGTTISAPASTPPSDDKPKAAPLQPITDIPPVKKLFVHIREPDDHNSLMELKRTCSEFAGNTDIILVLGPDKRSAIKLPFRVDGSDGLISSLVKQLGEDCVVLK